MDKIIYTIESNGIDGRGKLEIINASFEKEIINNIFNNLKWRGYYSMNKRIIDPSAEAKKGISKLNGVERLILGLEQRELPVK